MDSNDNTHVIIVTRTSNLRTYV